MSLRDLVATLLPIDLARGLGVTGRYLLRRKETQQYPDVKPVPKDRFRGMFGYSEELCNVCRGCEKACPISIIHIQSHFEEYEVDGKKRKRQVIDRYDIDVKRCMFCGLCEEACPTEAIWLTSKSYEAATYERNERLYFDKERLQGWEGVTPYPGVVTPREGQLAKDPTGKLYHEQKAKKAAEEAAKKAAAAAAPKPEAPAGEPTPEPKREAAAAGKEVQ